jgi:hypothetical protein
MCGGITGCGRAFAGAWIETTLFKRISGLGKSRLRGRVGCDKPHFRKKDCEIAVRTWARGKDGKPGKLSKHDLECIEERYGDDGGDEDA